MTNLCTVNPIGRRGTFFFIEVCHDRRRAEQPCDLYLGRTKPFHLQPVDLHVAGTDERWRNLAKPATCETRSLEYVVFETWRRPNLI